MFNPLNFLPSIIGMLIAFIFILYQSVKYQFLPKEKNYDEEVRQNLSAILELQRIGSIGSRDSIINGVLKDYEISIREIERRDNIFLIIGSILVTASLLILAETVSKTSTHPIWIYALASIGTYVIWLFAIHETDNKLDEFAYKRIKAIELAVSDHLRRDNKDKEKIALFGIYSYIYEKKRIIWWLPLREYFWYVILLFLSIAWLLIAYPY